MSTILEPHYLHCQNSGSNKFYIVVDLKNGQTLCGFGATASAGTWKILTTAMGSQKLREKLGKYKDNSFRAIGRPTKDRLLAELRTALAGSRPALLPTGEIELDHPAAAGAQGPATPTRRKAGANIAVWI